MLKILLARVISKTSLGFVCSLASANLPSLAEKSL